MRSRLTEQEARQSWAAYERGMSLYMVAKAMRVDTRTLAAHWRRLGLVYGRAPTKPRTQWINMLEGIKARTDLPRDEILWCALKLAEQAESKLEGMIVAALESKEIKRWRPLPRRWQRAPYKDRMFRKDTPLSRKETP